MSRSGYTDDHDCDDYPELALGRWHQAVNLAIKGARGQAMLRELAEALDAMPVKRLFAGSFASPTGEFCTLGVLGAKRGATMDDLGDSDHCDADRVGKRFGIAMSMAAEIMYVNDEEGHDAETPEQRWTRVRAWVAEQLADGKQ